MEEDKPEMVEDFSMDTEGPGGGKHNVEPRHKWELGRGTVTDREP